MIKFFRTPHVSVACPFKSKYFIHHIVLDTLDVNFFLQSEKPSFSPTWNKPSCCGTNARFNSILIEKWGYQ